jgi:hypothetical protein
MDATASVHEGKENHWERQRFGRRTRPAGENAVEPGIAKAQVRQGDQRKAKRANAGRARGSGDAVGDPEADPNPRERVGDSPDSDANADFKAGKAELKAQK